jgi:hypothetical protein
MFKTIKKLYYSPVVRNKIYKATIFVLICSAVYQTVTFGQPLHTFGVKTLETSGYD